MNSFKFYSPTYFSFGKGAENYAGALVKRFGGTKVLIHYGGGSVIRSGLLDRVKQSLEKESIPYVELGGRGNTQTLFNDSTISAIAQAHDKSSAQVIIRWHLQAGNICIPGSSNEQHIIEDYDVWDFELTDDEMALMTELEKDERFADY